jgi:hypothetical protein
MDALRLDVTCVATGIGVVEVVGRGNAAKLGFDFCRQSRVTSDAWEGSLVVTEVS